jgi:hypothetical protein
MVVDGENALEKFDDLVKGCDYDGVHTMIANLQTPAARAGAPDLAPRLRTPSPLMGEGWGGGEKRRAFGMWLPPSLTLPHKGGGNSHRLRPAWIAP